MTHYANDAAAADDNDDDDRDRDRNPKKWSPFGPSHKGSMFCGLTSVIFTANLQNEEYYCLSFIAEKTDWTSLITHSILDSEPLQVISFREGVPGTRERQPPMSTAKTKVGNLHSSWGDGGGCGY